MKNIRTFDQFVINEAELTIHYLERFKLRGQGFLLVDKGGGKYDVLEALKRAKFFVEYHAMTLIEKYASGMEKKMFCINLGDIKFKSEDSIYSPVFSVKKEDQSDSIIYKGSVFCALVSQNKAITLLIFDRKSTDAEIKKQTIDHLNADNINKFESIEHVYLTGKENILDLDISWEDFKKAVTQDGPETTILPTKVQKEMVFAPGTLMKIYKIVDGNKVLQDKVVSRTERDAKIPGKPLPIPLVVFFTDGSMKSFKKDDTFIVSPAKKSEADQNKKKIIGAEGDNYSGRIFDIGTYSKEKYNGKGASTGGAADYVRIMATEVF